MVTSANLQTKNDLVLMKILKNEMILDNKFGGRQSPLRNTVQMTSHGYLQFLTDFEKSAENMKNWMN